MPLTGKEMVKLALENGWVEVRQRGSHHHFKKEGFSYLVTIPVHGMKIWERDWRERFSKI